MAVHISATNKILNMLKCPPPHLCFPRSTAMAPQRHYWLIGVPFFATPMAFADCARLARISLVFFMLSG
jgi:hypothetical protein